MVCCCKNYRFASRGANVREMVPVQGVRRVGGLCGTFKRVGLQACKADVIPTSAVNGLASSCRFLELLLRAWPFIFMKYARS